MKRKVIIAFITLFIIFIIGMVYIVYRTNKKAESIQLRNVDMQNILDGTYKGEEKIGLVRVQVEVNVLRHEIVNIHLIRHDTGLGQDAKKVIPEIIRQNKLDVDSISGATISSKAIMKACENALTKGSISLE